MCGVEHHKLLLAIKLNIPAAQIYPNYFLKRMKCALLKMRVYCDRLQAAVENRKTPAPPNNWLCLT